MENEFVDFKAYNIDKQFREIYGDVSAAYRRSDKVILQRSTSEGLNKHLVELMKA